MPVQDVKCLYRPIKNGLWIGFVYLKCLTSTNENILLCLFIYYYSVAVITVTVVGYLTAQNNASNWYVTKIDTSIETFGNNDESLFAK